MRGKCIYLFVILSTLALVQSCGGGSDNTDPTPVAPANVTASGVKFITIDWDASPSFCYNLYWNTAGGVTIADNKIANVQPPYVHKGLIYNGTTYYYAVTSVNCSSLAESGLSAEVSATSDFPLNQSSTIVASDAEANDYFGHSVSMSGDYAIVGAYLEDGTTGINKGAAYVFNLNQGGTDKWGEVTKLTASDAAEGDFFGYAVSISGDFAIVGAYLGGGTVTNEGAAYLFNRNQGGTDNWGQVIKLTASDAADGDYFGYAVSISGDYAIVGASLGGGTVTNEGAAYVFNRNQGGTDNWGQVIKLTASDAADGDMFGSSVSISGDYAIVGADLEAGSGTAQGAAYVFYRNQGGADKWGQIIKLTASDAGNGDRFGGSVSISGDYAIVGAKYEAELGSSEGAAYVFSRNQGGADNWGEIRKLTATVRGSFEFFGTSVFISGDYAIVGAPREIIGALPRGAAHVYYRDQGGTENWGEITRVLASDAADGDNFGYSVAIDSDYAFVGAPTRDGSAVSQGLVYIY